MMLQQILACSLLVVSAGQVEVRPLAGPAIRGELVSLSREALVITSEDSEQQSIPVDSLLHVRPLDQKESAAEATSVWLELIDGSTLHATSYTVKDSVATAKLNTGGEIAIPTRSIKWVRFREQDEAIATQWNKLLAEDIAGDRLVVRRTAPPNGANPGNAAPVDSLDFLSGVLLDIGPETLGFQFNDRKLDVGRQKAEGLIYFHAAGRTLSDPVCMVRAAGGNIWQTKSVSLTDAGWELVSVAGVKHTLPLDQVEIFDYSAGKIVYLSDLTPETSNWHSFFGGKNELPSLRQLFAPRRDRNFDGGRLKLNDQEYDRGLALHSHSELVFRLPGEFRKLSAVAGIDDSLGENGHVILRIFGDKELLLEEPLSGADDKPLTINLDMEGIRKLRIEVDFGENLDIADHLNLCDIRVMK